MGQFIRRNNQGKVVNQFNSKLGEIAVVNGERRGYNKEAIKKKVIEWRIQKKTHQKMAEELNKQGFLRENGTSWNASSLSRWSTEEAGLPKLRKRRNPSQQPQSSSVPHPGTEDEQTQISTAMSDVVMSGLPSKTRNYLMKLMALRMSNIEAKRRKSQEEAYELRK